jgi:plastocyanin
MKLRLLGLISAIACAAPVTVMSQTVQNQSPAKVVHHFSSASTIIEQGDTITWIHSVPADSSHQAAQYVFVYLIRPDTVMLLKPNGPRPLQPFYAKAIRNMVRYARDQDELEKKLGHSLH